MSVENFCIRYPISPELTQILKREKRSEDMSLIAVLADSLVKEASDGLRALTTKYDSLLDISREDRSKMLKCLAGIIFGVTVVSLERTIVNKQFDFTEWHEDCKLALARSGGQLTAVRAKEETEVLSYRKWRDMISLAREDRTLAIFFEEKHRSLMPQALNRFFDKETVSIIRRDMIPIYKERAKFLV